MANFTMMIGLPGSGKSTKAKELAETTGAKIFSSDAYRAIYGSGEEDQSKNALVFQKLREDLMRELNAGHDVILDATNISVKSRRSWLSSLPKETFKQAYLILASYETCLSQNANRDRKVPEYVITRMYKSFDVPSLDEGFDNIITYYVDEYTFDIDTFFEICGDMNQNNPHHTLSLGEHMHKAYNFIRDTYPEYGYKLELAMLLHDIGKPLCKVFKDSKGNDTTDAHYYGHEHVGAYDVLFLTSNPDILEISWLINHHMDAFNWTSDKAISNWIKLWGIENYEHIKAMHEADLFAK